MPGLHDLIREYGDLLTEESRISEKKEHLRTLIAEEMARQKIRSTSTEHGSAARISRFKLLPRPEPVLGLLSKRGTFFLRELHAGASQGDPRPQVRARNPASIVRHREDRIARDQAAAGQLQARSCFVRQSAFRTKRR